MGKALEVMQEIEELEQMLKKETCTLTHAAFLEQNAKLLRGYRKAPVGGLALAMAEVYMLIEDLREDGRLARRFDTTDIENGKEHNDEQNQLAHQNQK